MPVTVTLTVLSAMPPPRPRALALGRHTSVLSANPFCGVSFESAMVVPPARMVMAALVSGMH